jgi:hypothetical protein
MGHLFGQYFACLADPDEERSCCNGTVSPEIASVIEDRWYVELLKRMAKVNGWAPCN